MRLDTDVLDVLRRARTDGNALRIGDQLDRDLYVKVNKALQAVGAKWNRGKQAHLFDGDAAAAVARMLAEGSVTTAQDISYFPTPPDVVDRLLTLAELASGMEVLEPSAGRGAIVVALEARGCLVDCVELNEANAVALAATGGARWIKQADFLLYRPPVDVAGHGYDRVVMNPPFDRGQDVRHVLHALRFVKPGGLLVSVMSVGVTFRRDRATAEFRDLVKDSGGRIVELPPESFASSGTKVATVIVVIPKAPAAREETVQLDLFGAVA